MCYPPNARETSWYSTSRHLLTELAVKITERLVEQHDRCSAICSRLPRFGRLGMACVAEVIKVR
ncbi:hypothetical protein CWO91_41705 [Bradyrhizobium genosp. SA-3]|nr:hypothetical protein CWO91_41705 [Bradyrhizobium genosp. SA-3]